MNFFMRGSSQKGYAAPPDKIFGNNNILWWSASDNLVVDGSNNITSWSDKGGFSRTLTGVATFLPTKVTDEHGNVWARFRESSMNMNSLLGWATTANDYLFVIVWKYRGPVGATQEGRMLNNSSGARLVFSGPHSSVAITPLYRANVVSPDNLLDANSGPVPENVHIVEFDLTSPSLRIRVNGVVDGEGNYSQLAYQPNSGIGFGKGAGSDTLLNLDGDVAEILLVKGTYTDAQKRAVYRYFDELYNSELYPRADFTETGKTTEIVDQKVIFTGSGNDDYLYCPSLTINPVSNRMYLLLTEGPNHGNSLEQFITLSTSENGGYTWSERRTIVPVDGVVRFNHGGICVTNTGRIIVIFYKVLDGEGSTAIVTPHLIYSDDDGVTWSSNGSDGNEILLTNDYPDPGQISGPGNPIVVSDGIIVPLYGRTAATGTRETVVYKSTDNGLTWNYYSHMAVTNSIDLEEPEILVRHDGILIGLMRSDQQDDTFMTYSWDEGLTWANSGNLSDGRNRVFEANAFNGGVVTPNNVIMGVSRHPTDNRTIVYKSTNKGQNYTSDYFDSNTGFFVYGKGVWHPGINKAVFVHCREQVGSPTGLGPTEIVCSWWNEVNS